MPFAIGTRVRMTSIDKYGFTGRDNHPTPEHVGAFVGTVCSRLNVTPDDGEENWCYVVYSEDGEVLELMHDEVTAAPLPVKPTFLVVRTEEDIDIPGEADVKVEVATSEDAVWRLLRATSPTGDWAVFELVGGKAVRRSVTFLQKEVGVKLS